MKAKLDTCALINLAHSKNLTNIDTCEKHGLQRINLSGVGGRHSSPLVTVGDFTTTTDDGLELHTKSYVVDDVIAGDKQICLLGLHTLAMWNIDILHHMKSSLRGECDPLRIVPGPTGLAPNSHATPLYPQSDADTPVRRGKPKQTKLETWLQGAAFKR